MHAIQSVFETFTELREPTSHKREDDLVPPLLIARAGTRIRETAQTILSEVMKFRRLSDEQCGVGCSPCASPHLPAIEAAVERGLPVTFVLPAFPGKSPNLTKVLGPLPDMAEQRSLLFLAGLCERIRGLYAPGAKIIICSDGRVFSDAVGMREDDVSAYQSELSRLIDELELTSLSTFNLEDVFAKGDFDQMRETLMNRFGSRLEQLKETIRSGARENANGDEIEAMRMYRGITRFLFEDSLHEGQTKSRTALQKEARARAYEVISRSNAWSELVADRFPQAVRLSIHPQICGSKKLGIRLIANENWMTPWHGVAVETPAGFILLKKSEAEALGAQLIRDSSGSPSHYKLSSSPTSEVES